jgi:hypothetical protein
MIEELYILRKKNIKLLEELAQLKLELKQAVAQRDLSADHASLELIEILDALHQLQVPELAAIKTRLEKLLESQGVIRVSNPSLLVAGLCISKDQTPLTSKHAIQKILKYGYMKNGEVFRPFLVEVA